VGALRAAPGIVVHLQCVEVGMSVLLADDRSNPDSLLYYAPPRYRRVPANTGIRPVLERLSRGDRFMEISPPLSPEIPDSELRPAPDLSVLLPDPFAVVGKVATVAVCLAALAAPGVYFFALGGELHISTRAVSTRAPESRAVEQVVAAQEPAPAAAQEPSPAAVEPVASEPKPKEPVPQQAAVVPGLEMDLISPLGIWRMFPTEAAPVAKDTNEIAQPAEIAQPTESASQAPQAKQRRQAHRRSHRARVTPSQPTGSEEATAAMQKDATQAGVANPIQAAFRAIFGAKQ
jgi:hypothetical protein